MVDHASNWARKLDAGQRPHIVVEAAGRNSVTLNDAIRAVGMNGQILGFGVPGTDHYALDFPAVGPGLYLLGGGVYISPLGT